MLDLARKFYLPFSKIKTLAEWFAELFMLLTISAKKKKKKKKAVGNFKLKNHELIQIHGNSNVQIFLYFIIIFFFHRL